MHAYSDWYYYMVMNPVDRIQTVWIRPDPDPDPVHLYSKLPESPELLEQVFHPSIPYRHIQIQTSRLNIQFHYR